MANVKYSKLLKRIITIAKSYGRDDHTLSAERILLAVMDAITGRVFVDIEDKEMETLRQFVAASFSVRSDLQSARKALLKRVTEQAGFDPESALYMKHRLREARSEAIKTGKDEVSLKMLLRVIAGDPTPFIRDRIANNWEEASPEEDPSGKEDLMAWVLGTAGEAAGKGKGWTAPDDECADEEVKAAPLYNIQKISRQARKIQDALSRVVFGQDNAVSVFTTGYFQAMMDAATTEERSRPAGVFLFAGPPGVGKTFLVENIVAELGMKDDYYPFNMSEFADQNAHQDLIGFGDNYKKPKQGLLTEFVKKHPRCILLFDEIEKAHPTTINLFLQILDRGLLTDVSTNKAVSFKDALIFFTTNVGREIYDAPDAFDFSGTPRKVILKALQKEINPETHRPFFPAALCSRFASGNVVMFNHMSAKDLCRIAREEIRAQKVGFEQKFEIPVEIDRDVYTSLLFEAGGNADARTLRSRASRFLSDEIYEFSRFMSSDEHGRDLYKIKNIRFTVDLGDDKKVLSLFRNDKKHDVLVFASGKVEERCGADREKIRTCGARNLETVRDRLRKKEFRFAIIDLLYGVKEKQHYIDIEDVQSTARDAFRYIHEKKPGLPIYVLQPADRRFSREEQLSCLRAGARGILTMGDGLTGEIDDVCESLYQQASMLRLASANQLVSFRSGQRVSPDGETVEITLFDHTLATAVDAEDTKNVMSGVSRPDVKFDEIVGAKRAKEELQFCINYLKDPKQYAESGLKVPRGILLYGPPGTGKTMLAKAVASAAGVTFIATEGNRFIQGSIGAGKEELHRLFSIARKYAPAILFIDEFESIAKERVGGQGAVFNGEDVLTALLTQMDGFNTDVTKPVFVLAATNFDVTPGSGRSLDRALLRRFDSLIFVDLPTKEDRLEFLRKKIDGKDVFAISADVIGAIATRSVGLSLADLDSILEMSLRTAICRGKKKVTDAVLDEAFETFVGGEKKDWKANDLENTARHEAGHALISWMNGETPAYVTVVARGNHAGYTLSEGGEKGVFNKADLLARIRMALGGRAAEIVYYGEEAGVSTGAAADLANATELARRIICNFGMDKSFGMAVIDDRAAREGEISLRVREAVNAMLDEELKNAVRLIRENRASLDALVEKLLVEDHLTGEEIRLILEGSGSKA